LDYIWIYRFALKRAKFIYRGGTYRVSTNSVVFINGSGDEESFEISDMIKNFEPGKE